MVGGVFAFRGILERKSACQGLNLYMAFMVFRIYNAGFCLDNSRPYEEWQGMINRSVPVFISRMKDDKA